jgi:hypothetical protein
MYLRIAGKLVYVKPESVEDSIKIESKVAA